MPAKFQDSSSNRLGEKLVTSSENTGENKKENKKKDKSETELKQHDFDAKHRNRNNNN